MSVHLGARGPCVLGLAWGRLGLGDGSGDVAFGPSQARSGPASSCLNGVVSASFQERVRLKCDNERSLFSSPVLSPGRFWDPQNFKSVTLGAQGSPITKMVSVGGRLWCGCQNRVLVLSPDTLQLEVAIGADGGADLGSQAYEREMGLGGGEHKKVSRESPNVMGEGRLHFNV